MEKKAVGAVKQTTSNAPTIRHAVQMRKNAAAISAVGLLISVIQL